jgi:hypothetical protein
MTLLEVPFTDSSGLSPEDILASFKPQASALMDIAENQYTKFGLKIGDKLSRIWLEKSKNPYLGEIDNVAKRMGRPGVHMLNMSYEWACTSGVSHAPDGPIMTRVLDWDLEGLGANLIASRRQGPSGNWVDIGWPGFVGSMTAVAKGRFAIAINQPPLPLSAIGKSIYAYLPGMGMISDWLAERPARWKSDSLPPAHLLRKVMDEAVDFEQAVAWLSTTPISSPAFFTVSGIKEGQSCVIERLENHVFTRLESPVAVANHFTLCTRGGFARGQDSDKRQKHMTQYMGTHDMFSFSWLQEPILNTTTRLVLVAQPQTGRIRLQGWEPRGCATLITDITA